MNSEVAVAILNSCTGAKCANDNLKAVATVDQHSTASAPRSIALGWFLVNAAAVSIRLPLEKRQSIRQQLGCHGENH